MTYIAYMSITTKQKQQLKAKAHALKPIVLMGNQGLTPAVQLAIEEALLTHELIKVRLPTIDRNPREQIVTSICAERQAEPVQLIGRICILYRKKPD